MTVTITPTRLEGTLTPPPSKSQAHRLLIAAALAGGTARIENLAHSEDIAATKNCLTALMEKTDRLPTLDCHESGSTLRFFIPLALALRGGGVFTGSTRLMERPQDPYFAIFREKNIQCTLESGTLTVTGTLPAGVYSLPGNVSSQFVTGLLYALPLLTGDSDIMLTSTLESRGYVDMTLDALRKFGIVIDEVSPIKFHVPGNQIYRPSHQTVEPDYSQAAFFLAANALGNSVTLQGLQEDSKQGDKVILEYSARLSAKGTVTLDVSQCPDLVPALAVQAALRAGERTYLVNAARLRLKECDRLDGVTKELCKLGARVEQTPDSLKILGVQTLNGGTTDSCNDHRIAMMLAVAATRATGDVTICGAEAVGKSYPNFWKDYVNLGGSIKL
ncbi:MAG: 3-phosphoshikimate 1-carboxyvinyltransferase [Oscillospiraceae bacterium]